MSEVCGASQGAVCSMEQLHAGASIERVVHLDRETLVRYAGASGDFNPIHYRDDIAKAVGLPGVLAHGMLTMGLASSILTDWLGSIGVVTQYQTRFTRPVLVDANDGADILVHVEVKEIEEAALQCAITVSFQEKTVLAKTLARVELYEKN